MLIRVIGFGVKGYSQITLEAINHLRSSKKVLYFPNSTDNAELFFSHFNIVTFESLSYLYIDGAKDIENYQRVISKLLDEVRTLEDIALLMPGHPRLGVTILRWLEKKVMDTDIKIETIPGISSFDTMVNDLKVDPLEQGSVIIDANRLLLYQYEMEPRIDHYIYHVCSIGTPRTYVSNPSIENRIDLLKNYLLRFFDFKKAVTLIKSPLSMSDQPFVVSEELGYLENVLQYIDFSTTLYIKGEEAAKKNINHDFLKI